ncbi:MAG: hypothetical protein KC645_15255 [Gemmatimonadetes bacterium]|nr:hypothetical protein [Gemmatimonadota bacterium]
MVKALSPRSTVWRTGSATLVLTYRPEHVQRGSKLHAFLAEAECQELALGPLDEASQKQLTAEFGGADLGAEAARWIQDLAKGNPLFLIELIRQCLSGDLVLPPSGPDEINLPSSIQQLFDRRLAGLTPDDRRTLEALAVWGRVASLTDLLALTGLDEEAIVASLERLDAAGLVRWGEEGTELWHELLRQSVLQGAVGARRQLLHRRAGRLLMDVRPQPRGEIALHCYRAGDRTTAFMFARAAAAAAERGGAVSEAIGLLRVAYNTAEPPIERSAVRLRLGELLLQRCDHEEARRLLATVRSLSSAGDPNEHDRWAQLRLLEAESRSGLDGEVAEALEHLWSSAAQRADSRLMVEIAEQTLRHHERRGRFAANAALALERVDRCLSSDDQHTLCTALRLGVIRVFLNDIERADAHTAKSLELARTTKARPEVMLATLAARIAFLAMVTRLNAAEGRELCEAGLSLAKRLGDIPRTFSITSNAGAHALEAGDVDRARALFDQCSSIISGAVLFPERQRLLINYGELYVEQGNLPAARLSFSSALQLAPSPEDECGTAARVGLALCDALEGALRSARRGRDSIADRFSGPLTPLLDSGLFAKLEFVLARRTGGPLAAIQCAERHTAALDAQRPGRWISLTLDVLPLLRVHDPHEANRRVERGVQLAVALDLPERLRRFRAVVASRD